MTTYQARVMAFVEDAEYLLKIANADCRLYASAMENLSKLEVPKPYEGENSRLSRTLQERFDNMKEGLSDLLLYDNLFKSSKINNKITWKKQ